MKKLNKLIYRWISKIFMDGCSDYNTLEVRKKSRTKLQARAAFERENMPHAQGMKFLSPFKAVQFVKEHGFPVVIKPNVSGYSRGSHFPITNYRELWKAAILVKIWWPTSIIEQYLKGKNYRVVAVKGDLMSVIRRYPPFVIGDGKSTISELIDQENSIRKAMRLHPVIHPIQKNNRTKKYLKKQGMTLNTIPQKSEQVELYNKIALAPGGIVETIDKEHVAPENRELFLKILDAFNASIFGIDVIFEKGIETGYKSQKCIFLELNSRPYLKMHNYPRYGQRQSLEQYYQTLDSIELADSGVF
ncbi:MAG: cyanophycin synthetase [Proteobacteria bacterium]|nr:cyanophycin synthetase [Pseudomonadota bacterium]